MKTSAKQTFSFEKKKTNDVTRRFEQKETKRQTESALVLGHGSGKGHYEWKNNRLVCRCCGKLTDHIKEKITGADPGRIEERYTNHHECKECKIIYCGHKET